MSLKAAAWNQLPLLTDTSHTLPAGRLEWEFGLQFLKRSNFAFSPFSAERGRDVLSLPTLRLAAGIGKRAEFQLLYEVLFVEEEEYRITERWKSGDLAFFTKLRLLDEHRDWPELGVKAGAKLPNAGDEYRVGTDETDVLVSGLAQKTFSSVTTTLNLGLLILGHPFQNARQDDLLSYGLTVTVPLTPQVTSVAEIAGQTFGTSHNERALAALHLYIRDGALTWMLAGRWGLLENAADWGIAAGVRWTCDAFLRQ